MKISYVIPCYRSEKTIQSVVDEIQSKMKTMSKYEYEIILVNDGSPDNTFNVIENICDVNSNIIGINHARNFGQHAAILDGFHFVSGDIIVCMDDDGQTPAEEVDKLLEKINEGYDVVYANYGNMKQTLFRKLGSAFNTKMNEVMLGKPKNLYLASYFAARKFVIDEVIKYEGSYPYLGGLILRVTNNICNVNVNHRERALGESGYSMKKLLSLWLNGFTAFSLLPLRIATYLGGGSALIGFVCAIVIVVKKILNPEMLMGWSSTITALLLMGGMILLVLGMLGEYIGRIYILLNKSPQYVIKSVINYDEKKDI